MTGRTLIVLWDVRAKLDELARSAPSVSESGPESRPGEMRPSVDAMCLTLKAGWRSLLPRSMHSVGTPIHPVAVNCCWKIIVTPERIYYELVDYGAQLIMPVASL
jgi:hypothetical protein